MVAVSWLLLAVLGKEIWGWTYELICAGCRACWSVIWSRTRRCGFSWSCAGKEREKLDEEKERSEGLHVEGEENNQSGSNRRLRSARMFGMIRRWVICLVDERRAMDIGKKEPEI